MRNRAGKGRKAITRHLCFASAQSYVCVCVFRVDTYTPSTYLSHVQFWCAAHADRCARACSGYTQVCRRCILHVRTCVFLARASVPMYMHASPARLHVHCPALHVRFSSVHMCVPSVCVSPHCSLRLCLPNAHTCVFCTHKHVCLWFTLYKFVFRTYAFVSPCIHVCSARANTLTHSHACLGSIHMCASRVSVLRVPSVYSCVFRLYTDVVPERSLYTGWFSVCAHLR